MSLADELASTAHYYRHFAEVETPGVSAIYEDWASGVAADQQVLNLLAPLPPLKRQPNLLFTAARYLGAPDGSYAEFRAWLLAHWDQTLATMMARFTQTNEAARCATLLPAFADIPGPVALLEVGCSAGLCLMPDAYSYRYSTPRGPIDLDPEGGTSPVVLSCELTGPAPTPHLPEVVWRTGIDLNPLDATNADDLRWLEMLVWPEHQDRRERLTAAAALLPTHRPAFVRGNVLDLLVPTAAQAPADATLVIYHTAVLMYLTDEERDQFVALVDQVRAAHPATVWLSNEGRGVLPAVREKLPAGYDEGRRFILARDGEPLGMTDPHGRSAEWF